MQKEIEKKKGKGKTYQESSPTHPHTQPSLAQAHPNSVVYPRQASTQVRRDHAVAADDTPATCMLP